jgi:hypothetical protein
MYDQYMHWITYIVRPDYIIQDRRGQFRDCIKSCLSYHVKPEHSSIAVPHDQEVDVRICAFTPDGDIIQFWGVDEEVDPVDQRGDF